MRVDVELQAELTGRCQKIKRAYQNYLERSKGILNGILVFQEMAVLQLSQTARQQLCNDAARLNKEHKLLELSLIEFDSTPDGINRFINDARQFVTVFLAYTVTRDFLIKDIASKKQEVERNGKTIDEFLTAITQVKNPPKKKGGHCCCLFSRSRRSSGSEGGPLLKNDYH